MSDYARMERAIRFVEDRAARQPSLREVADAVGLSPFHLQRLFKRWAGLSPKRFLQSLTAAHARALLRASRPVLDTALAVGLSGPGRLHDLIVAVDAVTPGDHGRRGAGLVIRHGFHETPYGPCLIGATDRGVCWLAFSGDRAHAEGELHGDWPRARFARDEDGTRATVASIFERTGPVGLHLRGTNFQIQVWRALLEIPEGATISYGALADRVGRPTAARAVASAVGRNPVSYLVPCHRVLRESGAIGGYRWGTARKRAMLLRERGPGANSPTSAGLALPAGSAEVGRPPTRATGSPT